MHGDHDFSRGRGGGVRECLVCRTAPAIPAKADPHRSLPDRVCFLAHFYLNYVLILILILIRLLLPLIVIIPSS